MQRRVGLSGLAQNKETSERYQTQAARLLEQQVKDFGSRLEGMRDSVLKFYTLHHKDLQKDPVLQSGYERLCDNLGIDPFLNTQESKDTSFDLAKRLLSYAFINNPNKQPYEGDFNTEMIDSTLIEKPIMVQVLLNSSPFRYKERPQNFFGKLAIHIVEVALASRDLDGGLIPLKTLVETLNKIRTGSDSSSYDKNAIDYTDIILATEELNVLNSGITIVEIAGELFLQSIPKIMDTDTDILLKMFSESGSSGSLTLKDTIELTKWTSPRCQRALDNLIRDGTCWLDFPSIDEEPKYWIVAMFFT